MAVRLEAVTYDAADPARLGAFWAALLEREPVTEEDAVLLPGTPTQVGLRFVRADTARPGLNALHLHLTSAEPGDQERTVATVLRLGGRRYDEMELGPDDPHVVVADPEGNELCVIPAGNRFLDGCGFLGEVACDGLRGTGVFWSEVLGWPLVWDQDEETAVQSPAGGTKVSWGGPPLTPRAGPDRQRFDLVADDVAAETVQLLGLGARETADGLVDPDAHPFRLRSSPAERRRG